jgi:hypothetical protein
MLRFAAAVLLATPPPGRSSFQCASTLPASARRRHTHMATMPRLLRRTAVTTTATNHATTHGPRHTRCLKMLCGEVLSDAQNALLQLFLRLGAKVGVHTKHTQTGTHAPLQTGAPTCGRTNQLDHGPQVEKRASKCLAARWIMRPCCLMFSLTTFLRLLERGGGSRLSGCCCRTDSGSVLC